MQKCDKCSVLKHGVFQVKVAFFPQKKKLDCPLLLYGLESGPRKKIMQRMSQSANV